MLLPLLGAINSQNFPDVLSSDEETKYLEAWRNKDFEARNKLIEHNLRLVAHIVKKFENTGIDKDDLLSIGTFGLIKAIDTFNFDATNKLATYAARCIENEILMYFRSMRKSAQDVSLSDCIETGADGTPLELMEVVGSDTDLFDRISARESIREVRDAVQSSLTEQERRVITLRYGLDGKPPMKQREAAAAAGISRSYVSRIEKRALEKLRRTLASGGSSHQVTTWD